jgi:predicted nucleic acid-binding protein
VAVVVSDAGPLIAFIDADAFDVLALEFQLIIVPVEVYEEAFRRRGRAKPRAVKIDTLEGAAALQRFAELRLQLDPGESAALALAEVRGLPLLVDERAASNVAATCGLAIVSTADVLCRLVDSKRITAKHARRIVQRMRELGTFLPDIRFSA